MEKGKMVVDLKLVVKLDELLGIQDQIDKINEHAAVEFLRIEHAHHSKFKQLYNERNEYLKTIDDFWRFAFLAHPFLRSSVNFQDRVIFKFLRYLEVKDVKSGYSITLNFDSNHFFKNTHLEKTFIFHDDGTTEITATPIEWELDFVPKKSLITRPMTSAEAFLQVVTPKESFFTWFSHPEQKERTDDFQDKIADAIIEELWINPLSYLITKPDMDEITWICDDETATKKSEVQNIQLDDSSMRTYEMVVKNEDAIDKLNEEVMNDVLEVEKWHNEICKTAYDKRKEIIGTIPDFWWIAFLSHPVLTSYIIGDDEKIFKCMTSLEVEGLRDVNPGYSITLIFAENDYFENTELRKTYKFLDEGVQVTTTNIRWKEGKGKVPYIDHNTTSNRMPISYESFFAWFSPVEPEMMVEIKDVIADSIKDDLWPNPLSYFYNNEEPSCGDDWMSPKTHGVEKKPKRVKI